ncbi:MAG TPA: IMP dehydrogenase, partial [Candidatus Paceibacterota bacterium]|nr:IMP dehydrogenase [Candidatus Paceibacterota bacterium]
MEIREGLTFDDVLLVPKHSDVYSRKDVDTSARLTRDLSLNIPLVSANMDTVTESAMARAMARAGGIGIIHRFLSIERQAEEVRAVKRAENAVIEDPLTIGPDETLGAVRKLMKQESVSGFPVVEIVRGKKKLVGILTGRDLLFESDNALRVRDLMTTRVITAPPSIEVEEAKKLLHKHRIEKLPLVGKDGTLAGLMTLKDLLKRIDNPHAAKDKKGRLLVGAAVGVKDETLERTEKLLEVGADVIVIDIAHGHNVRAIETTKLLRSTFGSKIQIIAGNIATAEAAEDLAKAGADGLKVGIGPG